ncbi:MAG: FtsB family cell division protein [Flavobacterium sp.]
MKNPYKDRSWYKFISNKYVWVLLFFVSWMLFLDNYSYLDHRLLNKQIQELEDNKEYYKEEINQDLKSIKSFKNPDQIEKYAREKYYMKRENEDIYIIEFEDENGEKVKR